MGFPGEALYVIGRMVAVQDPLHEFRQPLTLRQVLEARRLLVWVHSCAAMCRAAHSRAHGTPTRQDAAVVAMLVTPTSDSSWRVDVSRFSNWLTSRWPEVRTSPIQEGQRAHLWTWADSDEVWIPAERDCVWIEADLERVSVVAAWLASTTTQSLVLCDEGYGEVIPLEGATDASIAARLQP